MLQARIEILGVLTHDDNVDIVKTGFDSRQVLDGSEIGIEIQSLSQSHVDTGKSPSDGRRNGTFDSHVIAVNRIQQFIGKIFATFLEGFCPGIENLPLDFYTRGFNHFQSGFRHLRTNSVTGNQRNLVFHATSLLRPVLKVPYTIRSVVSFVTPYRGREGRLASAPPPSEP